MNNTLEQTTYAVKNSLISMGKFEFLLYLVAAFIIGYLVHYFFSNRRDYVRTPKKSGFYYNHSLSAGYYPNSEHAITAPKQIQTQIAPVQTLSRQVVQHTVKNPTPIMSVISTKDDLKKIEGIGPKIEELLNNAGILTWNTLAKSSVEKLQSILTQAGKRFQMHDPSTWGEQSHLAETGQWNALQEYQDFLNGGKRA